MDIVKCLRIEFVHDGQHQNVEATEGKTIDLPAGSEVVKALYGYWPGGSPDPDAT